MDSAIGAESEQMRVTLLSKIPSDPRKNNAADFRAIYCNKLIRELKLPQISELMMNYSMGLVMWSNIYVELYNPPDPDEIIWVKFDHIMWGKKKE